LSAFWTTLYANILVRWYIIIRDHHYVHKHRWEKRGGCDKYDRHSDFLIMTVTKRVIFGWRIKRVIAGCRIISDCEEFPIREVLKAAGKDLRQIPCGSREISRFGLARWELCPLSLVLLGARVKITGSRRLQCLLDHKRSEQNQVVSHYLRVFAEGLERYAAEEGIETAFAVLRDRLSKMLRRIGVVIKTLENGTKVTHGKDTFETVQFFSRLTKVAPEITPLKEAA
jgi:hypothetical protein